VRRQRRGCYERRRGLTIVLVRFVLGVLCFFAALFAGCESGGESAPADGGAAGGDGVDAADADTFNPPVEASDPCLVAGFFFDDKSDCDVVRCPELTCDCPALQEASGSGSSAAGNNGYLEPAEVVTLIECVPGAGCLSLLDCKRVCDPALRLTREACEVRIDSASAQACATDDECPAGTCRQESVGRICVDPLPCSEDGHCGSGFACLFDPDGLDPETSLPLALGTCSDGSGGSLCYEDSDCVYDRCSSNRCASGLEGDSCSFNRNCASGFCRITDPEERTGSCVSGQQGSACLDDGDCEEGLHCTGNVCFSDAVGQHCESDEQCANGICISGSCRAGLPGSLCEDDADCSEGFCVGFWCATGTLLAPCQYGDDCLSGLICARQTCTDGAVGHPCSTDDDCSVLACVNGVCSDGSDGSRCDAPDDCQSNRCADPAGVEPGECTSGDPGSYCVYDANCASEDCSPRNVCN
jgi:hypothetical protein